MRGLAARVRARLERRLNPVSRRPLAVALSGGGDSLALTLMADAWARRAGRELVVLTVDHGLSPHSSTWTQACGALAARLGRCFVPLAWTAAKPSAGLPAAARAARHRLLADAARELGASVILMGHTSDDRLEAGLMRAQGSTTPDPREWAPSPAWPEGRGVFLLRPLLEVRRAELRAWLAERGETWIDDPANEDPRFARSRARLAAGGNAAPAAPCGAQAAIPFASLPGALTLAASALDAQRLAMACVCAGGGVRLPAHGRAARVVAALSGAGPVKATLAGARVERAGAETIFARNAGESARGGLAELPLPPGDPIVWDGRFEIVSAVEGLTVRCLAGLAARLSTDARRRLAALPAPVRGGLPAIVATDGEVRCPCLEPTPQVTARSLVGERFAAASGLVDREHA